VVPIAIFLFCADCFLALLHLREQHNTIPRCICTEFCHTIVWVRSSAVRFVSALLVKHPTEILFGPNSNLHEDFSFALSVKWQREGLGVSVVKSAALSHSQKKVAQSFVLLSKIYEWLRNCVNKAGSLLVFFYSGYDSNHLVFKGVWFLFTRPKKSCKESTTGLTLTCGPTCIEFRSIYSSNAIEIGQNQTQYFYFDLSVILI